MRKFVCVAIASAFMFTAVVPNPASAAPLPVPAPVLVAGGSGAGAGLVTGFLVIVALLDLYDLTRRTTCSGDFLGLGGPGFDSPMAPTMNVLPPQCPTLKKIRRNRKN